VNPAAAAARLPDVQADADHRGIALDEVGIDGFAFPLTVLQRDGTAQPTVGDAELLVGLAAAERGTHMSRFVEALRDRSDAVTPSATLELARHLRDRLSSESARVRLNFPMFFARAAPASGAQAPMRFTVSYRAASSTAAETIAVRVEVAVTSLCPCSREISDYGAHSQRGYIRIDAEQDGGPNALWPEDLIEVAEAAASAPVYPLLKRVDERAVTMTAYDNPAFVEDLVRDAALALREDPRISAFEVRAVNEESIHDHRAVARVRWSAR
jgi:GTP cyclohydrolase FolE2